MPASKKAIAGSGGGGKGKGEKKKKAKAGGAADATAGSIRAAPEDPVLKEYEGLELPKLEEAVAQLQTRLGEAQGERRHAQIEKDAASGAYRRLEGQLAEAKAALAREAQAAEGRGWRHKLELRAYSDKATAMEHHHTRRLGQVAEEKAELLGAARLAHERAEARWAARTEKARLGAHALVATGVAGLEALEAAQREKLAALRGELEGELRALKGNGVDALARAAHALALRHKVEAHALEELRDQHLHDLLTAHQAAAKQMRDYYAGIVAEQAARIDGLEREAAGLQTKAAETQTALQRLAEETEELVEPLAAVMAREAELQSILKQQTQTRAGLHRAKGRLRFLRRQHQALRAQNAEAQCALAAAERERDELDAGAEGSVRRVEEIHARKARELEARVAAVERELAVMEGHRVEEGDEDGDVVEGDGSGNVAVIKGGAAGGGRMATAA